MIWICGIDPPVLLAARTAKIKMRTRRPFRVRGVSAHPLTENGRIPFYHNALHVIYRHLPIQFDLVISAESFDTTSTTFSRLQCPPAVVHSICFFSARNPSSFWQADMTEA